MGIVIKQSAFNLASTILGFIIGAVNLLVLGTIYLEDKYLGLWGYILSTAFLLFPLLTFGINNTIVKYYSSFNNKEDRDAFLTQMLFLPLLIIIPAVGLLYFYYDELRLFIASYNQLSGDYLWCIASIAFFQAYFELFYAWTKVHMKTQTGHFLKEVFYRLGALVVLCLVATGYFTQVQFIYSLVLIYVLRTFMMQIIAFKEYTPRFIFKRLIPNRTILKYCLLMMLAGSVGTAMLDLDKVMINQYLKLDTIAWYNIAIFIAAVIAIPARVMAQITHPLTAQHFNKGSIKDVEQLYKRSSLNLSIISGFLVLIISCNAHQFYALLPTEFAVGIPVLMLIAIVKFIENLLGTNNAILYNSNLYKSTLWLGLGLVAIAVILNSILIPRYGLYGAAIATTIAYSLYALGKIIYVYHKLDIHPWTKNTGIVIMVIAFSLAGFYFWELPFHPVVNILIKSILILITYAIAIVQLHLSSEIDEMFMKLKQFLNRV